MNENHYIDSHAHITCESIAPHVQEVLTRAQSAGIKTLVNICTDAQTLALGLELSKTNPWVYNTAATTPHDVEKEGESFFPLVEQQARAKTLIAIGETGLDYHYKHSPIETQKHFLRAYLKLAHACQLPVVIHCRDAFADFFKILDEEYQWDGKHGPGVLHCFTGTLAEAQQVIERGWYISFSGIITFKKSENLKQVVKEMPLEKILIETDSPYLAPQSKRGKPNEPAYLPEIAEVISQIKGIPAELVMHQTTANARQLFQFPQI